MASQTFLVYFPTVLSLLIASSGDQTPKTVSPAPTMVIRTPAMNDPKSTSISIVKNAGDFMANDPRSLAPG